MGPGAAPERGSRACGTRPPAVRRNPAPMPSAVAPRDSERLRSPARGHSRHRPPRVRGAGLPPAETTSPRPGTSGRGVARS